VSSAARGRADWVEHVLATGGAPYLKTREHTLSWPAAHSLDVALILATAAALPACLLLLCARAAAGARGAPPGHPAPAALADKRPGGGAPRPASPRGAWLLGALRVPGAAAPACGLATSPAKRPPVLRSPRRARAAAARGGSVDDDSSGEELAYCGGACAGAKAASACTGAR